MMGRNPQFAGIAGLIVLFFGLITALMVNYDWLLFIPIHLFLAIILFGIFFFRGGLSFFRDRTFFRAAQFGSRVTLYSGLFAGVVILTNYIAARNEFFRFDSTEEQVYSLSPQTKEILGRLEQPLVVRGFFLRGEPHPDIANLMKLIVREFPTKVSWKVIDPEREPQLVEKFGIAEQGTIHISFADGDLKREIKVQREVNEETIVNAILKLTRSGKKIVYYLAGHGEPELSDAKSQGAILLKQAIEGENLEVHPLTLTANVGVPSDTAALIIMGTNRALLEHEVTAITSYLKRGGNALFFAEPRMTDDITELVHGWGVEIGSDIVVDQEVGNLSGPGLGVQPLITDYASHPLTENFHQVVMLTTASSVSAKPSSADKFRVTEVARTSPTAWAEKKLDQIYSDEPTAALEGEDLRGPVSVAVTVEVLPDEKATPDRTEQAARIVVFGDRDFVLNRYLLLYFNRDFFLNALNWAIGEDEGVTIRARALRKSLEGITSEQYNTMFLLTAILAPELLVLGGLAIWWTRKV